MKRKSQNCSFEVHSKYIQKKRAKNKQTKSNENEIELKSHNADIWMDIGGYQSNYKEAHNS